MNVPEQTTEPHLQWPSEIDAHLSDAALDGAAVVLHHNDDEICGRFDLADGFGLVTFLNHTAWSPRPGTEVRVSYHYDGRMWQFVTQVVSRCQRGRWHLRRPRMVRFG